MRISDKHLSALRDDGYVIIKNFLTPQELEKARAAFGEYYPTAQELQRWPHRFGGLTEEAEQLQTEFPFGTEGENGGATYLNHIATHPAILSGVGRFLGIPHRGGIRLTQAAIWAKYAGYGSYEQGLHYDYQGNTLVVPRDDADYQQVNFILYYSDVTAKLGPTTVVSKKLTRSKAEGGKGLGDGLWPPFKTRDKYPELYDAEKKVIVPAGSMLIFTMSTLHRASAMTATLGSGGYRWSQHLVYRAARHSFQGYHLYSRMGENPDLERFIETAMPEQREALGFPPPNDPYWTATTLAGCKRRYPGLDWSEFDR